MTAKEFNQCLIPTRLDFKTSEAARLVLVVGCTADVASKLCGGLDVAKIDEAVQMIVNAQLNNV